MENLISLEYIQSLFDEEDENYVESKWEGDNAWQGFQIIAKYIDPMKKDIICGASHDEIYSVDGQELIDAGITRNDLIALAKLNWTFNEDNECFSCYV